MQKQDKIAVLIDGENISRKYIKLILDEVIEFGTPTYKRVYADFSEGSASAWKDELRKYALTPIFQINYTKNKNASDSAMIIDAMDILYTGNVDGFCIVSSDGDFTRLAIRLKESGMDVIGMGESKTPRSFRAACTVFTDLEILYEAESEDDEISTKGKKAAVKHNVVKVSEIENVIIEIINENNNKGRRTGLGEIGSRIQKKYNDFDVRQYGYSSLSTFIDEIDSFVLIKENNTVHVALKEDNDVKEKVVQFAKEYVKKAGKNGIDLGALGQKIHGKYPNFKVKEYGYSTLQKFISGINIFRIESDEDNRKVIFLKEK